MESDSSEVGFIDPLGLKDMPKGDEQNSVGEVETPTRPTDIPNGNLSVPEVNHHLSPTSPDSDLSMRTCASEFEDSPSRADMNGSGLSENDVMKTANSGTDSSTVGDMVTAGSKSKKSTIGGVSVAELSFSGELKPETMELYDSPRLLKLAAKEGRAPFYERTSSTSSTSSRRSDAELDVETGDEETDDEHPELGVANRDRAAAAAGGGGDRADGSDEEEDTYTYQANVTPGGKDVQMVKKIVNVGTERPNSLTVPNGATPRTQRKKKKITVAEDLLNTTDDVSSILDQTEMFTASMGNNGPGEIDPDATENIATPDDLETPDEIDDSIMEKLSELEFDEDRTPTPDELRYELELDEITLQDGPGSSQGAAAPVPEPIPTLSAREECEEARNWRQVVIAGIERRIDMKAIEPYKKVLSHGGYMDDSKQAIIVFTSCYLPDCSRRDYEYVMDNLFLYCLTTLDTLIAEDYLLVYLHGATHRSKIPSFKWIRKCYQMIDRRLRKNLKGLYIVHPTFLVKTLVIFARPFISSKFSRKLRFVGSLDELARLVPMGQVVIPEKVRTYDEMYYAPKNSSSCNDESETENSMKTVSLTATITHNSSPLP